MFPKCTGKKEYQPSLKRCVGRLIAISWRQGMHLHHHDCHGTESSTAAFIRHDQLSESCSPLSPFAEYMG